MILNSIALEVFSPDHSSLTVARKAKAVSRLDFHGGGEQPIQTLSQFVDLMRKQNVSLRASANVTFVSGKTLRLPTTSLENVWVEMLAAGVKI